MPLLAFDGENLGGASSHWVVATGTRRDESGKVVAIEVKESTGRLTEIPADRFRDAWNKRGREVVVITGGDAKKETIRT